jgi:cytochrome c oxidase subunit IV
MAEHVTPVRTYVIVGGVLLALTALTVAVSFVPLGILHVPVALAIATAKAVLVVLFFMHVRHSGPITRLVIAVALIWLFILIAGTLDDYLTRSWLGVPGH